MTRLSPRRARCPYSAPISAVGVAGLCKSEIIGGVFWVLSKGVSERRRRGEIEKISGVKQVPTRHASPNVAHSPTLSHSARASGVSAKPKELPRTSYRGDECHKGAPIPSKLGTWWWRYTSPEGIGVTSSQYPTQPQIPSRSSTISINQANIIIQLHKMCAEDCGLHRRNRHYPYPRRTAFPQLCSLPGPRNII